MWTTKKQTLVTLSPGEAEFVAKSYCRKTFNWLHRLFWELSAELFLKNEPEMYSIATYSDRSTALSIAKSAKVLERNNTLLCNIITSKS